MTWTSRTAKAEWAERLGHTSVVDAAGAIYVIGGSSGITGIYYNDVWASTDGGARAGLGRGAVAGVHWVGTTGVLQGVPRVLRGTAGGTQGCYRGYLGGPRGTTWEYSGVLRGY